MILYVAVNEFNYTFNYHSSILWCLSIKWLSDMYKVYNFAIPRWRCCGIKSSWPMTRHIVSLQYIIVSGILNRISDNFKFKFKFIYSL